MISKDSLGETSSGVTGIVSQVFSSRVVSLITEGVSGTTGFLTINTIDMIIYGEYRVVAANYFGSSVPVTTRC